MYGYHQEKIDVGHHSKRLEVLKQSMRRYYNAQENVT